MDDYSSSNSLKRKHSSDDENKEYDKKVKIKEDPDLLQIKEEPGKSDEIKNDDTQHDSSKSVMIKTEIEEKESTSDIDNLRLSVESDSDDENETSERYETKNCSYLQFCFYIYS